jgi:hypothetical protein
LIRDPLGEVETVCLLGTDPACDPKQIAEWFVLRWQVEVTLEAARRHLGVETQRQWADKAIARTTPPCWGCSRGLHCGRMHCIPLVSR